MWTVHTLSPTNDAGLFARAAAQLLSPDRFDVFADSYLQIGPLYLLVLVPGAIIAGATGWSAVLVQTAYLHLIVIGAAGAFLRQGWTPAASRQRIVLLLAIGVVAATTIAAAGHYEEVFTGMLLVGAGIAAERRRLWLAVCLVAAATGFKAWGILGVPLLLLAYPAAGAVTVLSAGIAVVALSGMLLAPFSALGTIATFEKEWSVQGSSLISLVVPVGEPAGWWLRAGQGIVVTVVLTAIVLSQRRRLGLLWQPWQLVTVLIVLRLATDPLGFAYYLGPLALVLLISGWPFLGRKVWFAVVAVGGSAGLMYAGWILNTDTLVRAGNLVVLAAAALAALPHREPALDAALGACTACGMSTVSSPVRVTGRLGFKSPDPGSDALSVRTHMTGPHVTQQGA